MPKLIPVERDYTARAEKMNALGPLVEKLGTGAEGRHLDARAGGRRAGATQRHGARRAGRRPPRDRRPTSTPARRSWRCRGRPTAASRSRASGRSEKRTGIELARFPEERADDRITFGDIAIQPRKVIASAEWSGLESRGRRYSPFTSNVEHLIPWRTLTGRQQLLRRPRVDARDGRGPAGLPAAGRRRPAASARRHRRPGDAPRSRCAT